MSLDVVPVVGLDFGKGFEFGFWQLSQRVHEGTHPAHTRAYVVP